MSTYVLSLIDDAAKAIGDPNKQRVELSQWLSIYNRSNRAMCEKVDLLRKADKFSLVQNQTRYKYPATMTRLCGIQVSETPTDESSFRWLDEMFEDEFRDAVRGRYPLESLPSRYFATSSWWYLIGAAEVAIADGGCIDYFSLPDEITDLSTNPVIQVDDIARDYITEHMIALSMQSRNRWTESALALQAWEARAEGLIDKLEDRSDDRRSTLSPRRNRMAGMR